MYQKKISFLCSPLLFYFFTRETPMIGDDKYFYYTNDKTEA